MEYHDEVYLEALELRDAGLPLESHHERVIALTETPGGCHACYALHGGLAVGRGQAWDAVQEGDASKELGG